MTPFNIHEADMASPHRYLDPAGGEEPHPFAGQTNPETGKPYPETRPKTKGKLFGRSTGEDASGATVEIPAHLEDALREAAAFLAGEDVEAAEAATESRLQEIRAKKAAMRATT